ncbi:Nucleoside-diphosphate-sugar epimerase dehydratase protein [Enterobacter sp. FY-07]|uniref:SDR family oxidoreductase n=1 Tax=Kosakonia oryzendophytica TaxID=1005665 RepID=UPI000776E450|nr:SDR family oxidoreductase [Kosakonia oryzendophytica]AMO49958.1 Nucleoside-diphosphate-sugar epimerase dehydratase protein [Enterobacter sp. FY-07]TDT59169.1 nucleoside-diphosphate-sugar epimerase [Enterobacter sp. AG5470]WBT60122.1 SDR family oxidoreductase [Kosakonia oryzendophytica]
MHVFLTGATGWVGATVAAELLAAGHQVSGLARNPGKAQALLNAGGNAVYGTLDDHQLLFDAAAKADAVIHTAFNHDFSRFADNCAQDQHAIEVLGNALLGSERPLLVTSGFARLVQGRLATEDDKPGTGPEYLRRSEQAAQTLAEKGVRTASIRLAPTVHGIGDHGFVPNLIALAKKTGVAAWPGNGENRWAAVHRLDAAKVYRLALETGVTQPVYHAVAEEGIPMRDIAIAIGNMLGVPAESRDAEHFGWFATFAATEMAASSERTRKVLGWQPGQRDLLTDLADAAYYANS